VGLKHARETVGLQDRPDSRGVALGHFVNSKNQDKIESLLDRQVAKQGVLRTAGSALFGQDDQWIVGTRIPSIGQPTHILGGGAKIGLCKSQERSRDKTTRIEAKST
jgi:hypothetical protein